MLITSLEVFVFYVERFEWRNCCHFQKKSLKIYFVVYICDIVLTALDYTKHWSNFNKK